ncbi:zinc finger protein 502-like isoform X1 [Scomber japonicus]|uniref:zinc finger protein 502-like isoform X1 n=1 Tax=Scomber japonicus TaxID=13676 RepID=UPI0023059BA3|nr:zinc finger protein 502-like isoform X1 [Scomber japonicus]
MANRLLQLRVFVNERLTAAAEEIFGAVERTILEYRNDMYLSREDVKHSGLLMLAEGLNRQMEFSAVCQEVGVSAAETFTQPTYGTDASPEPQELWTSWDKDKLQELSESDVTAACVKHEESTQPISCRQTQTETIREEELLPSTSANWLKTEEEDDGYGRSEAANVWQPLSSDSMDENNTSDAEYTERGGPNSHPKQRLNSPNTTSLSCKLCGESFQSRSSLVIHVKSHSNDTTALCPPDHAALADSAIKALGAHRGNNLCYICGKTFTTRTHLKRHMLVHTGLKPHCCKICGRRFGRGECLRVHMRIHTVEKPYSCEVCGREFRQRGNMICHIRTHTGEKPHRCIICSRPFAYKKDMLRHMQVHSKNS